MLIAPSDMAGRKGYAYPQQGYPPQGKEENLLKSAFALAASNVFVDFVGFKSRGLYWRDVRETHYRFVKNRIRYFFPMGVAFCGSLC